MPSSSALAADITITAAPPSEICEALPAVIVPSLSNAGCSAPSDSAVVPGRTPSSVSTSIGSPLRWGTCTGDDLLGQPAVLDRRRRLLVAGRREGVLALPGDLGLLVVALGGEAHGDVVEGIGQAVVHHRVDQRHVAEAVAGAGAGQQVGGLGHRLHAAGHHDLGVAGLDHLVGQVDGVEPREADLVDGRRRHGHRDPGLHRRLAGRDLARPARRTWPMKT